VFGSVFIKAKPPVLDRLEPATGALALGKALNQTLGRSFRQKMSTGCDMETGELSAAFAE
jgi:hypothetical protein